MKLTSYLLLYIFLSLAVIQDITCLKVSNRLILTGFISSFLFHLVGAGVEEILGFFVNITLPVIFLYLLYLLRILGAGDIKLFSLVGSFINLKELVLCIICSFVWGALLSIIKMLYEGNFLERIQCGMVYIFQLAQGNFEEYEKRDVENLVPFTIAIFLGISTVIFLELSNNGPFVFL